MAIDFPDSPSVNDTFAVGGRTYIWNGTQWKRVDAEVASVSPSLTVTGDFTADTDTLVVDSANNRVGIGTTNPLTTLDVDGNATVLTDLTVGGNAYVSNGDLSVTNGNATIGANLTVDTNTLHVDSTNNRVGIGTTTPNVELHLKQGAGSGVATPWSVSHDFVIDSDANSGIGIYTPNTANGYLRFGDSDYAFQGGFQYDHTQDLLYTRTGGTDRITLNSAGHQRLLYQPSVFAFSPGTDQVGGGTTPTKVQFNNTQHNTGGHYSTSNDRFTCPVAGEYLVSWYGVGGADNAVYRYYLRINGSTWNDYHVRSNGTYDGYSRTDVLSLNANDYLEIWFNSDNGSAQYTSGGNTYYTFSVRLLG